MRQIRQITLPVGDRLTYSSTDMYARPVLIRAYEGVEEIFVFIEENPSLPSPGALVMEISIVATSEPYPAPDFRHFSSCLTVDGTALLHGVFRVTYNSAPTGGRMLVSAPPSGSVIMGDRHTHVVHVPPT